MRYAILEAISRLDRSLAGARRLLEQLRTRCIARRNLETGIGAVPSTLSRGGGKADHPPVPR